jgi:uncharacterized protein DUF6893
MNSKWKIIGGTVLAVVVVGAALNFKDLRRYIRIRTM